MSTHQDLIPEPHSKTSKRKTKDRQRRAFYIWRILEASYKNCLRASQKKIQAPTQSTFTNIIQGPIQGFQEDLLDLLTRICTRSCWGLWQHFTRICTRSSHKELQRPWPRSSRQDPYKKSRKIVEDLTRSWYKNLPTASHKSFHPSTSNTWHVQDLHARTS